MTSTNPIKAVSSEVVVFDAPRPKVYSVEAMLTVPMAPRSPRLKQTMAKDKKPAMKEKQLAEMEKKKNPV